MTLNHRHQAERRCWEGPEENAGDIAIDVTDRRPRRHLNRGGIYLFGLPGPRVKLVTKSVRPPVDYYEVVPKGLLKESELTCATSDRRNPPAASGRGGSGGGPGPSGRWTAWQPSDFRTRDRSSEQEEEES